MKSDISLKQLEAFCAVIEQGSFSAAARRLNLSQPTVSAHLTRLEKQIGASLLTRRKKEILATPEGNILYRYGNEIINLSKKVLAEINQTNGPEAGAVKMGASNLPGTYLLPRILKGFRRKFPHINVNLKLGDSEQIINDIISNNLEVGVAWINKKLPRNLGSKYFARDKLVLVAPKNHEWCRRRSVSASELKAEPFLMREQGSALKELFIRALALRNIKLKDLNIIAELGSNDSLKESIKNGLGVGILPSLAVSDEVKKGQLKIISVTGLSMPVQMCLIYNKTRPLSALAGRLVKHFSSARP